MEQETDWTVYNHGVNSVIIEVLNGQESIFIVNYAIDSKKANAVRGQQVL